MVGERALDGLAADESVEHIVVSLLPSGPRTRYLDRALAADVAVAVLYLQHKRGAQQVCLQCYQRCDHAEPQSTPGVTQTAAPYGCTPAGDCGWSFFLIEKMLEDDHAAVQAYLFHE